MPATEVYFYQDERRRAPVVEWLEELRGSDRRAYAKCVVRPALDINSFTPVRMLADCVGTTEVLQY